MPVNEVRSTLDRKSIPIVAWYVLSNESYINLVIRDVFPTLCSPKNTSLNFFKGFEYDPTPEEAMVSCVSEER
jgi:hypothetical protein